MVAGVTVMGEVVVSSVDPPSGISADPPSGISEAAIVAVVPVLAVVAMMAMVGGAAVLGGVVALGGVAVVGGTAVVGGVSVVGGVTVMGEVVGGLGVAVVAPTVVGTLVSSADPPSGISDVVAG